MKSRTSEQINVIKSHFWESFKSLVLILHQFTTIYTLSRTRHQPAPGNKVKETLPQGRKPEQNRGRKTGSRGWASLVGTRKRKQEAQQQQQSQDDGNGDDTCPLPTPPSPASPPADSQGDKCQDIHSQAGSASHKVKKFFFKKRQNEKSMLATYIYERLLFGKIGLR